MKVGSRDIEAYAEISDERAIVSLLSKAVGELQLDASQAANLRIYEHNGISVVVQPSEDGFVSVWIRGSTPWSSSPVLGRYLASNLRCTVHCDPEDEFPEISPHSNVFLQIKGDSENLVAWG